MNKVWRIVFCLTACVAAAGCSPVKPWERGILAEPSMSAEPDPLHGALQNQIYFSKEASSGGGRAAGGGCGCN